LELLAVVTLTGPLPVQTQIFAVVLLPQFCSVQVTLACFSPLSLLWLRDGYLANIGSAFPAASATVPVLTSHSGSCTTSTTSIK
jgi:hypothetical protein